MNKILVIIAALSCSLPVYTWSQKTLSCGDGLNLANAEFSYNLKKENRYIFGVPFSVTAPSLIEIEFEEVLPNEVNLIPFRSNRTIDESISQDLELTGGYPEHYIFKSLQVFPPGLYLIDVVYTNHASDDINPGATMMISCNEPKQLELNVVEEIDLIDSYRSFFRFGPIFFLSEGEDTLPVLIKSSEYKSYSLRLHSDLGRPWNIPELRYTSLFADRKTEVPIFRSASDSNRFDFQLGPGSHIIFPYVDYSVYQAGLPVIIEEPTSILAALSESELPDGQNPDIVLNELSENYWQTGGAEMFFDLPNFDLENSTMETGILNHDSTFGYIETKEYMAALPPGQYEIRLSISNPRSLNDPVQYILPDVRARVFNDPLNPTISIQAVTGEDQKYFDNVIVPWKSDGITPWRMAIDLMSLRQGQGGSVRVAHISYKRID